MNKPDAARDIKMIHIAKSELNMDDSTYRAILAKHGNGATSSTKLTAPQRAAVLGHMKAAGFRVKVKAPGVRADPQLSKVRALWWSLADAGAVTRPADAAACDAAIETWAKRQISTLAALRFASSEQLRELVEQLKQWCRRVGAH